MLGTFLTKFQEFQGLMKTAVGSAQFKRQELGVAYITASLILLLVISIIYAIKLSVIVGGCSGCKEAMDYRGETIKPGCSSSDSHWP